MERRIMYKRRMSNLYRKLIILYLIEECEEELHKEKKKVQKRIWSRDSFLRRDTSPGLLAIEDYEQFRQCLRITPVQFESLLRKLYPIIQRTDTTMRSAIPARLKLEITLAFLATGNSYKTLSQIFRVSTPAISLFMPEVLDAVYECLRDYMKIPDNHTEWKKIETGFNTKWNFPGVYGAVDGKHVLIRASPECASEFYNYQGRNSIILTAVVDDDYCFICTDIGTNETCSDGGVFQRTPFFRNLQKNMLPDGGFLVGDDAFTLSTRLMKPYKLSPLTYPQQIFNYRLSRARRIVENVFGILVSRFRIFERPIATNISVTEKIIRTACTLHNWLRKTSTTYITKDSVDYEDVDNGIVKPGSWRNENLNLLPDVDNLGRSNHSSRQARELRENYTNYFVKEGAVSWQDRMIQ